MTHNALTAVLNVGSGDGDALQSILHEIGNDIRGNRYIKFAEFETIHFARFVMMDNQKRLLFTTTHDGPVDAHLAELVVKAKPAVDAIFGKCEGYPQAADGELTHFAQEFTKWIKSHTVEASAFYRAYPNATVKHVRRTINLRDRFNDLFNTPQGEAVMTLLSAFPVKPIYRQHPILRAILLPFQWVLAHIFPLLLHIIAPPISKAPTVLPSPAVSTPYALTEREAIVQNELTILAPILPQRLANLKRVLGLINFGTKLPSDGTLNGVSTIHFARWVILDQGKLLLFESNYDGAWESYIGEFIDRAAMGLDAIWGCCESYPERGAKDEKAFKQSIIDHQVRADVFYSAYPRHSVKNILNNLRIYETLKNLLGRQDVADFLRRL